MPNDTFVMSVRQSAELDHAFERNGWTPGDVKRLSIGAMLADVLQVVRGNAEIKHYETFRETGELTLHIPALPAPTLEDIQTKFNGRFSWVKSIERNTAPTEAVTLKLVTVLREDESKIVGAEYERRIAPHQDLILGFQQAAWLEEHQDEFPEFMALLGKIYIDFSGIVVVGDDGRRGVFCLDRDGGRWYLYYDWLVYGFGRDGRVASSSKQQTQPLAT